MFAHPRRLRLFNRATGFRGIHAAHPAKLSTSAQFLTPEKPFILHL
ncbi:hypothetical protein [Dickeya dianthicola]|nr:hypothetical protein [Dickeya dianthicola]